MNMKDWHATLPAVHRYLLAVVIFLLAFGLRYDLLPTGSGFSFITFYPALVIGFYLCGSRPGILLTALCSIAAYLFFIPASISNSHAYGTYILIATFLISAFLIGTIIHKMQTFAQQLHDSEQRYLGLLEDQTEVICRFKADGTVLFVNDAYCRFFGKIRESLIGQSWQPMAYPEDLPFIKEKLDSLTTNSNVVSITNRVINSSGNIHWMQFINRGIFNEQGTLVELQAVGRDITSEKLAQDEIQNKHNQLNQIASSVPGVIYQYVMRPDGSSAFPYASEAIRDIYRVTPESVIDDATAVLQVIHPDDFQGVIDSIMQSAHTLKPWKHQYRVRYSEGTVRWLYGNSIPNKMPDGSILWNGFITDITTQKQVEHDLLLENEKNKVLLRNASDGIHILNRQGDIIEVSDSFCTMLGYSREDVIGMNLVQWDAGFEDITAMMAVFNQQFFNPTRTQFETKHRRKDGSIYDVEISGFPLELNGEKVIFNSSRDISERKSMEAKLKLALQELEDLYDNAPCGYHSLDRFGTFQNINATELEWLGLSKDEVIGKQKLEDFFTSDSKAYFRKNFPIFLKHGHIENLEFDLIREDGSIMNVNLNATAINDAHGRFIKSRSVLHDITDLKSIQKHLRQITTEQQLLLDNELVGMIKLKNRHFLWANKAMHQVFGYELGELQGKSIKILYPNEASFEAVGNIAYPILNAANIYRTQLELVRKNGDAIWLDISGKLMPDDPQVSMWMMVDITANVRHEMQVEFIAYHDVLTGLPNRLLVSDRLNQALAQEERLGNKLAVCFLDLDEFKPVNDLYGHEAGDQVLIEVAQRIKKCIRINDTVGRLGGDEFVLILTNLDTAGEYEAVLERIIEAINAPITISQSTKVVVGASIGVTIYPTDGQAPDILLRHADQAMYQAKQSGRNRVCLFEPLMANTKVGQINMH